MEPITIGLLASGAYLLLKKKGSTATKVSDGGRTVVDLPSAEWEAFMDSWMADDEAERAARRSKYGANPDTWEELFPEPMTTYPTPGLLGPAPVQPSQSSSQLNEFLPGISDMWLYAGGAAAAYYFFLRKK